MKKGLIIAAILILIFSVNYSIAKDVVGGPEYMGEGPEGFGEGEYSGPSSEDISCLEECIGRGCGPGDEECIAANSKKCEQECGVEPAPEPKGEGEACIQECILKGCDERDFSCQRMNVAECDKECGMVGEPEAQSEEEQCIRDCINAIDPSITCSGGTFEGEGERGNAACQKCANECEHLYSGPCLTEELWEEKENACSSQCEHCYGEPVMGPSGQGYECTVDIKCADASEEFGDDPGEGPGIGQEGYVAPNVVLKVADNIISFFKGLFE